MDAEYGLENLWILQLNYIWPRQLVPHDRILGFLDQSRYYFFQVAPQLYS
jgi:hypothetical protein